MRMQIFLCVCVCVCVSDWVTLLHSRSWHNIVNELFFNLKKFKRITANGWYHDSRKKGKKTPVLE